MELAEDVMGAAQFLLRFMVVFPPFFLLFIERMA